MDFDSILPNIHELLLINRSANGGSPILVETIDLMNSVIIYLSQSQIVNFPNRIPDSDSHNPVLLDLFLSCDASICSTMDFLPLGSSGHVVVSVPIEFPITQNRMPHFIA